MSDLYPTKTRLALLGAVLAGDVVEGPDVHGTVWTWLIDPPYAPRKVQARMSELEAAGWVRLPPPNFAGALVWSLTNAGRAVLDAAEAKP